MRKHLFRLVVQVFETYIVRKNDPWLAMAFSDKGKTYCVPTKYLRKSLRIFYVKKSYFVKGFYKNKQIKKYNFIIL